MKILALEGSPRKRGNSTIMLRHFVEAAESSGAEIDKINVDELNIESCTGCLRCNLIKRCSVRGDDWEQLSKKIYESDILIIASPVYFFHFPSGLKKVIDRFRSFVNVRITENGLIHSPWNEWKKKFVLLLSMGSPDLNEGKNLVQLLRFITGIFGPGNELYTFSGTRLAVSGQIEFDGDKLKRLYEKLLIPGDMVENDLKRNRKLMSDIYELGLRLGSGK